MVTSPTAVATVKRTPALSPRGVYRTPHGAVDRNSTSTPNKLTDKEIRFVVTGGGAGGGERITKYWGMQRATRYTQLTPMCVSHKSCRA